MKMKAITLFACASLLVLAASCNSNSSNNNQNQPTNMMATDNTQNALFPRGERNDPNYFTGDVYLQMLVQSEQADGYYSVGSVTFEPGGRTNWHTHPSVQTLIVTEGNGWYQERGKAAVKLEKGSVIPIPVGVEHWHGASKDSKLVHIAITNVKDGSAVTWMGRVTDDEFNSVHQ